LVGGEAANILEKLSAGYLRAENKDLFILPDEDSTFPPKSVYQTTKLYGVSFRKEIVIKLFPVLYV
jgi:TorA maturation chaperone TorD